MSHATADLVEFAHRAWPAHPHQLAPIHAEIRRWLESLNLSDDTEQAFVRAVDEAASNVVEHAYAPVTTDDVTIDDAASDELVELTFWTEIRPSASRSWITAAGGRRTPSSAAGAADSQL